MRKYASISPMFWLRGTGKRLRGFPEAQVVALYLMSAPAASMVGIYHLSLPTLCHETGLTPEGASKGLQRCIAEGLVLWDEADDLVWVPNLPLYQIGDRIGVNVNGKKDYRHKAILKELAPFKGHRFYELFLERYGSSYLLEELQPKPLASPFEGAHVYAPAPVLSCSDQEKPDRSDQPPRASSLAQALELDPESRARQIETDPHSAGWLQPDRWPEVVAVAEAFAVSAGQKPRLGQYARDPGVRAIVAGLAAGFSQDELCRVAGAEWLKSKGLSAMSIEVCRRELGDTGQAKAGASEVGKRAAAAHERRIAAIQKAEREKLRALVPPGTECGPFDLSKVLG